MHVTCNTFPVGPLLKKISQHKSQCCSMYNVPVCVSVCRVLVLAVHLGRLTLTLGESSTTDAAQVVSIALLSVTRLLSNRLSFCLGAFHWVLISSWVTTTYVGSHLLPLHVVLVFILFSSLNSPCPLQFLYCFSPGLLEVSQKP